MFAYYLQLGLRHLRRNPLLTALMVATLAIGIASSMSTLTILNAMSADPIPHKSDRLFVPLIDLRAKDGSDPDPEPPSQLSYRDFMALYDARRAVRQSGMFMIAPVIDAERADLPPYFGQGIAVHADFFPMMEVSFSRGGPWTAEDERRTGRVVVIRESLAQKIYGTENPIGRNLKLGAHHYQVTGVVSDDWNPWPKFYRLIAGPGPFAEDDDVFVPFPTAIAVEMDQQGNRSCYGNRPMMPGFKGLLDHPECVWLQLWVELASPADAPAYRDFLAGYVAEQRKLGRFPRPDNHRLHDVMHWLAVNEVVSQDAKLQTYLAFGFLLVCLVNVVGLLLAKFSAAGGEIGVRRALGATKRAVFQQYLIESAVVGLAGGLLGLGFTFGALWVIRQQSDELAALANLSWPMLITTLVLSLIASTLAGLFPTWRASNVTPALQLKSQ